MAPRPGVSAADLALSRPIASSTVRDRLLFCVLLAIVLHVAVLLGVDFNWPQPAAQPLQRSLDVTLATQPQATPEQAELLAQAEQIGSDLEQPRVMDTPAPAPEPAPEVPDHSAEPAPVAPPEPLEPPSDASAADPVAGQSVRDLLLQRAESMTSARPSSQFAPAENPRVRRISSASTRTAVEAAYINAWRNKVESLGNLNYPAAASRRRLEGDLRVLVEIDSSGNLLDARVLDSSGSQVLDEAALHIVQLAAPYLPFPEEMRREMDVLQIVRTWQFRRGMMDGGG